MNSTSKTEQTKLQGFEAIAYAEAHALPLSKYSDPTEGAREDLTVDEARAIAREEARLIWIDVSPADQILAAIAAGFAAGAADEWEAPEFAAARDLTERFGCVWDFDGWRATASTIRTHQMLGGVPLASAIRDAVETDEVLRPYRAGETK